MRLPLAKLVAPFVALFLMASVGIAAASSQGVSESKVTQSTKPVVIQPDRLDPEEQATQTAPTTTLPDFSGVDFVALAQQIHGDCGQWHDLAIAVGWPESEWPTLSYVIHRESRCNIDSWNKTDPASGSRGLMQINGFWCRPSQWSKAGWLQDRGILTTCDDLFNPEVNLRAGLAIWLYGEEKHGCGWRGPWATKCS